MGNELLHGVYATSEKDLEEGDRHGSSAVTSPACAAGEEDVVVVRLRESNSILAKMRAAELWMNKKLNIEPMGIERLPEEQRRPPSVLNMMFLWFSMLMAPGMITVGALGPLIGLSVQDSIIVTVVATIVGSCLPAFTATLSPLTGLRQVVVSRYAFGMHGAKLCSLLNIIINIGYGIIGSILAGQLLRAVSGGSLDIAVGIVIIVLLAFLISFLGFNVLQRYESVAWFLIAILLIVQWAQSATYFPTDITTHALQGRDYTGAGLTYFAIIFGQCCAWCSITGDYCVHFPSSISKWTVFGLTWAGLTIPTLFVGLLSCYLGGAIISNPTLAELYGTGGIGAIIIGTMHPVGFSKFVGVFYALACLSNLAAILYSSALSVQLFGHRFLAVPRFIWVLLLTVISLALALGGRDSFEHILTNLLPILGYWTISFGLILMIEHLVFRPNLGGYDLEGWCDAKRLPLGIAAVVSLCSAIALSFLGMNQTWYSGPLAKRVGIYGGDVGDYIVIAAVGLIYPVTRMIEIKYVGR